MQQKITILNKRGEKLVGVLHETGSPGLVVLCHGFRCTKDDAIMVNLATALENEGISAFRFDFSGNGESGGNFQSGDFWEEVEDLRAVVEYFTGIIRSTIAVLGHSKGGSVVLLYASKYQDIGAVVNVSGCYNLNRGIGEYLGKTLLERLEKEGYIDIRTTTGEVDCQITEESVMEQENVDMHEACQSISEKCRVLTVHGSADEINPVEDALEFAKVIPNHRLEIIEGANHRYTAHQNELASAVLVFIKECIQHAVHVSE